MSSDIDRMLAARADAADPPRIDPGDVVAHGERLLARRRRRVGTAAVCCVALVVGAGLLIAPGRDEHVAPAGPSDPTRTTEPGARPLGYGQGQVLHLGGLRIDTGLDFVALDLTDDGAALTTLDGTVWFSDGTDVERVGETRGRQRGHHRLAADDGLPREWVVSDSSGSLLAWVAYPDRAGSAPELVVFDSGSRSEVARAPIPLTSPRDHPKVVALAGREVFVAVGYSGRSLSPTEVRSFDIDHGAFDVVDEATFQTAIRGVPRAVVLGSADLGDVLGTSDGRRGHLVQTDTIEVSDSRLRRLVDPHSGEALELALPPGSSGYTVYSVWFGQWLDDDQFTVATSSAMWACRISAGQCRILLEDNLLGDRDTAVLLPGDGSIGADWALERAGGI